MRGFLSFVATLSVSFPALAHPGHEHAPGVSEYSLHGFEYLIILLLVGFAIRWISSN